MARQIRKGLSRTEATRGEPIAGAAARALRPPAAETDRLLDDIDTVLDEAVANAPARRREQTPDDAEGWDPDDEPDYPVLHRWLGYLCVTLFIWILIVSALGAPVLWIRYGFN